VRAPEFPFYIDASGIDCWVYRKTPAEISAAVSGDSDEAYVGTGYSYEPFIAMREYDERVLLHEVLHVLVRTDPSRSLVPCADEDLVRHITSGLFAMGWRWRVLDRSAAAIERDAQRALREAVPTRTPGIEPA
jgi:hypothetical protein